MPMRLTQKPTVLIVDDERDVLDSMAAFLSSEMPDIEVRTAESGFAGLEVLGRQSVNLILVDFKMPKMNGLEFLERAKALAPSVPTIMLTAFPDPELAARAVRQFGVALFIAKPFDLEYLVKVVGVVLRESRPVGTPPART